MDIKFNSNKMFDIDVTTESLNDKITTDQMYKIIKYVRACETAELLMNVYGVRKESRAIELGYEIYELMLDDKYTLEAYDDAVIDTMRKHGYIQ